MVKTIDSERLTAEFLGMQRWEDEGGQMIEDNDLSHDPIFIPRTAPIHARRRVKSLQWNERFVIRPFYPGVGMVLNSENTQSKSTTKQD